MKIQTGLKTVKLRTRLKMKPVELLPKIRLAFTTFWRQISPRLRPKKTLRLQVACLKYLSSGMWTSWCFVERTPTAVRYRTDPCMLRMLSFWFTNFWIVPDSTHAGKSHSQTGLKNSIRLEFKFLYRRALVLS